MDKPEIQYSLEWLENMKEFFKFQPNLNHIDLSGLQFKMPQLTMLCKALVDNCSTLLAVHLNDIDCLR